MKFSTGTSTKALLKPWGTWKWPPNGYARACTAATGELAKAMPASIEPRSMSERAGKSPGVARTRSRLPASRRNACIARPSDSTFFLCTLV
ncbi:hypothetical protein D3C72_2240270 [compost metagenome]